MIEWERTPKLRSPVLVTAFEGWNDAGEAATDSIDHIRQLWDTELLGELEPDDYYDFQVTRPHIRIDDVRRSITWPTTRFYLSRGPDRDFVLVHGIEAEHALAGLLRGHSRSGARSRGRASCESWCAARRCAPYPPNPLTGFASAPGIDRRPWPRPIRLRRTTGIVGVLQHACDASRIPAVSLWAAVPYVSQSPCPKATLAMISRLEDVTGTQIPPGDLPDESAAWQRQASRRWRRKTRDSRVR